MRWFSTISDQSLSSAWCATSDKGEPTWEQLPLVERERFRRFVAFATEFHRFDVEQKANQVAALKFEAKLRELLKQVDVALTEDERA